MEQNKVEQLLHMETIGRELEQKRILKIVEETFNHSFLKSKGEMLIEIVNKILDKK